MGVNPLLITSFQPLLAANSQYQWGLAWKHSPRVIPLALLWDDGQGDTQINPVVTHSKAKLSTSKAGLLCPFHSARGIYSAAPKKDGVIGVLRFSAGKTSRKLKEMRSKMVTSDRTWGTAGAVPGDV